MLVSLAFGAKKERDWKMGRLLDSTTSRVVYDIGAVTNTSGTATASGSGTALDAQIPQMARRFPSSCASAQRRRFGLKAFLFRMARLGA